MSVEEHKKQAPDQTTVMIVTVSDTRTEAEDKSGKLIRQLLEQDGHLIANKVIVKDEQEQIEQAVVEGIHDRSVDAVIVNGGTGIAARDVTIEAVEPLFEKEILGFGEIFRMLSYTDDIGSAAIMSRAAAGTAKGTAVFAVPGSSGAVKLAMTRLICPEISHIVRELRKDRQS
ncbi:MogA/MoaB family molybdenum cofactor biosynthesis protein [Alkalicoccus luteus]|uniref:Molybdenum cofactor biosynthesis protein B n=1 Tax=Alkalicoccus luteus TaxID=1237094 RepID=A0A969PNY8_9BACI|nr:molybdenum cofactor biosynthesis protein B [Alkalicoccus luteus]NJP36885.1 molybdenum cofactor biosynthesis protein MoaB [Alkalicoccus luteus]